MPGFPPDDSWTEQDVRETIIRPVLEKLGYGPGDIQTEFSLKYRRRFLGHKKPKTDPILRGRADYIVHAGNLRWVIDAKKPGKITDDDREQAYSYAIHPEIRAVLFSVISGSEFEFYRTFFTPETGPVLRYNFGEASKAYTKLYNLAHPSRLVESHPVFELDPGKPLGPGLRSIAKIIKGHQMYTAGPSFMPSFAGLKVHYTGGSVMRREEGGIIAIVQAGYPSIMHDQFAKAIAAEEFEITSESNELSIDPANPTIFTAQRSLSIPAGTVVPDFVTLNKSLTTEVQLDAQMSVIVAGFLAGQVFRGKLVASSAVEFIPFEIHADVEITLG